MAETLGSLCDKLSIVRLKIYHTKDEQKSISLSEQQKNLVNEIDEYVINVSNGSIPKGLVRFAANKVYNESINNTRIITGNLGQIFSELCKINCDLWHEQEKVYDFSKVKPEEKDIVVYKLAILNLERNICIDAINNIAFELCPN